MNKVIESVRVTTKAEDEAARKVVKAAQAWLEKGGLERLALSMAVRNYNEVTEADKTEDALPNSSVASASGNLTGEPGTPTTGSRENKSDSSTDTSPDRQRGSGVEHSSATTTSLKVGDKVRRIISNNSYGHSIGDIDVVTQKTGNWLHFKGGHFGQVRNYELAEEPKSKYKIGDSVRIVNDSLEIYNGRSATITNTSYPLPWTLDVDGTGHMHYPVNEKEIEPLEFKVGDRVIVKESGSKGEVTNVSHGYVSVVGDYEFWPGYYLPSELELDPTPAEEKPVVNVHYQATQPKKDPFDSPLKFTGLFQWSNDVGVTLPSSYIWPQSGEVDTFEESDEVVLDEDDPFDAALIDIVEINRKKRSDYASDKDIFSNFKTSSKMLGIEGFDSPEAALFNIVQKIARLKALRENGRLDDPKNESVIDTYKDLATYAVILYAIAKQEAEAAEEDAA